MNPRLGLVQKNRQLEEDNAVLRNESHELRNLLAVIHRDGGHYVSQHGIKKAVEDAITLWYERVTDD